MVSLIDFEQALVKFLDARFIIRLSRATYFLENDSVTEFHLVLSSELLTRETGQTLTDVRLIADLAYSFTFRFTVGVVHLALYFLREINLRQRVENLQPAPNQYLNPRRSYRMGYRQGNRTRCSGYRNLPGVGTGT
ncbi:MAG: hypothetical protein ACR5K7_03220 [Symbiopectobacterium sp.]